MRSLQRGGWWGPHHWGTCSQEPPTRPTIPSAPLPHPQGWQDQELISKGLTTQNHMTMTLLVKRKQGTLCWLLWKAELSVKNVLGSSPGDSTDEGQGHLLHVSGKSLPLNHSWELPLVVTRCYKEGKREDSRDPVLEDQVWFTPLLHSKYINLRLEIKVRTDFLFPLLWYSISPSSLPPNQPSCSQLPFFGPIFFLILLEHFVGE